MNFCNKFLSNTDTSSYVYDFYGNKRPNSYKGEKGSVPNLSDDHTHDIRFNLNLKYIRQITREAILFDTGEIVPIPYSSYKKVKEKFFCLQMNTDL